MAPANAFPGVNMHGYELVCSLKANNAIPVHKYRSTNTGITVFIAEIESPVMSGYFDLATESFDDNGLAHTLEHLIFLGSEDYPYKGVLDLWANRCLASGSNAFTDIDHTCYTMTNASSEGFLSLMQLYLDHILYPMLKESAFITEVYHINGEGEDSGVVYSEMQRADNMGEVLAYNELRRAIYPGKCCYKSISGGALINLRESVDNEKIRNFHKKFYRPENLSLIITGQMKHGEVFKALQPLEAKIMSKGDRGPFEKPLQTPIPPLTESVTLDVLYACDDEDNGIINIGWRGPSAISEIYDLIGCSLLLKYLTDTTVSPLQKEFIEIDDPYACNVAYSLAENAISLLYVEFEGVPKAKIHLIKDRLINLLKTIHNTKDGIDMKRMKTVVHKHLLEVLSNLENNPHDAIAFMVIGDVLYGNTPEDLNRRLNQVDDLQKLENEPEQYWLNILKKYLIDGHMVCVHAIPSIEKKHELTQKEQDRLKKRIEALGPEGLKNKEHILQQAIQENEKPIPIEFWKNVPTLSIDSVNYHRMRNYATDIQAQHPKLDVTKLPFFTYLDHINTNFLYLFVVMDTTSVPKHLRPYIPLILEAIEESPVRRDGKLIPYQDIVAELEGDTIATHTSLGFNSCSRFSCGSYSNSVQLILQVEVEKYAKGIQWIKELLYQTEFLAERLKIIATKIINDVAQAKRRGNKITRTLIKGMLYDKDSIYFTSNMLYQQKFLLKIMKLLENEKDQQTVLEDIEVVRKALTKYSNINLIMAVNVDKLTAQNSDLYTPWDRHFPKITNENKIKLNITPDWEIMKALKDIPHGGCILGLGCIESAFLYQCCSCVNDFFSPDLAPLLVCLQYLTQLEGPLWKGVRGQGYAYSYSIHPDITEGLLYLMLYGSSNIVAAYKEAKTIVESHWSDNNWDSLLFESAKSSLIFEAIEKEKTVRDLVTQSSLSYFRKVPHDYNQKMVRDISKVTIEDIKRVAPQYLKSLFDTNLCKTSVVCHSMKASEVSESFKEWNQELKVYNNFEETHLNE